MVQSGRFREDLYYRLAVFFIPTPPLRNHPEDVPLLAEHLWKNLSKRSHKVLPSEIIDALKSYPWPGNVRALNHVLRRLNEMFRTNTLTIRHLQTALDIDMEKKTPMEESPACEKEIMLHRAQCLKHLKRVHEVIHAIQFTLQLIFEDHKADRDVPEPDHTSLSFRFHDLEMLCMHPLLFYTQKLFNEISGLKGKINYLLNVLQNDSKGAERYWIVEMAEAFKQALSAIFEEIENVLREK